MRKTIIPGLLLALLMLFQPTSPVFAQSLCSDVGFTGISVSGITSGQTYNIDAITDISVSLNASRFAPGREYRLGVDGKLQLSAQRDTDNIISFNTTADELIPERWSIDLRNEKEHKLTLTSNEIVCEVVRFKVRNPQPTCTQTANVYQIRDGKKCYSTNNGCTQLGTEVTIELNSVTDGYGNPWSTGTASLRMSSWTYYYDMQRISNGNYAYKGMFDLGSHQVEAFRADAVAILGYGIANKPIFGTCGQPRFIISENCPASECVETPNSEQTPLITTKFDVCSQITNEKLKGQCEKCSTSDGVWTAIGCIKTTPEGILERFIALALGLGGGVALLTTIAGGFILTTSQGQPERANSAKEMITASVVGLLFIIFSVVILQFIGVTILKIPGFGST